MTAAERSKRPSAKQVDLCAAQWLERRHREGWTEAQQGELDAWQAEDVAHRIAFLRVEAAWARARRLSALRRPQQAGGLIAAATRVPFIARFAAAALVLTLLGSGAAYLLQQPDPLTTYTTAVGERRTLALADGSSVEMNTDTVMRLADNGKTRMVWLDRGEAFFNVRHNDSHPFIVMAGGHRVTDLGTKFLVRSETKELKVLLVEGAIRFDAPDGRMREPLLLAPGDSVTAKENTITVSRNSERQLARDLGWRRGVLVFDNTTLADAVAEFNRYNRETIVITDPSIAALRIDGTFPNEDLAVFARATRQLFELRLVEQNGKTLLSR